MQTLPLKVRATLEMIARCHRHQHPECYDEKTLAPVEEPVTARIIEPPSYTALLPIIPTESTEPDHGAYHAPTFYPTEDV
jgi:hypothetical protein